MSLNRYRLSRHATVDLEQIADYLGDRSPAAADRVIDTLFRTFDALTSNPEIGTSLDHLRADLQMFVPDRPADRYVVFYYRVPDGILIAGVIHSARDWLGMFMRGEI